MALTMCVCSGRFRLKGLQAICQAVSHFLHALPLVSNPMPLSAEPEAEARPWPREGIAWAQHDTLVPTDWVMAIQIQGMTQQKLNW